jgi:hypothetical protein
MKIISQSLFLSLLLLSLTVMAADEPMIESFNIMPSICVVAKANSCQQKIRFQWRLSHSGKSCLYQTGKEEPLYCSDSQQQTNVSLMLTVEKENEFIIRLAGASQREVRRRLKIRELGRDVRQSRRHLWSVF